MTDPKKCPKCGSIDIQYKHGWWETENPPMTNFCYACGNFFTKSDIILYQKSTGEKESQ